MAVHTQTDRRFRRAHVKPLRRRRVETTRRVVYGAGVIVIALLCGLLGPDLLRTSRFLEVDSIVVEGNTRVSEGELLFLIGQLKGQNILTVDLEANRDQLFMSGWIEAATLSRILPSTVKVSVVERTPAALGRFGSRLYLIDGSGAVIEELGPRFTDLDLPIVDGLSSGQGAVVDERRADLASSLISALASDRGLAARVSQIGVGDPHDAVVLLDHEPTLIRLGEERFVERLRRWVDLAPTLRSHVPEFDYVDMRFEQRVTVGNTMPGETHSVRIQ